jgi:hypothetical protein
MLKAHSGKILKTASRGAAGFEELKWRLKRLIEISDVSYEIPGSRLKG